MARNQKEITIKLNNNDPFGERLFQTIVEWDKPVLRLDCGDIQCMTAADLGMLVTLDSQLKEKGGRLSVCNVRPFVYETLEVTALTKVFEVSLASVDQQA